MNTDSPFTLEELEELERTLVRIRRSALKDSISWADFVLFVCNQKGWNYAEVIENEQLLEQLNVPWLRTFDRTKK